MVSDLFRQLSTPGHDEFELLGVDEAVAVPVEDLERLPDLGSLQSEKKTMQRPSKCLPVRGLGTKLFRLKSASGSSDSAIYPLLRSLLSPPIPVSLHSPLLSLSSRNLCEFLSVVTAPQIRAERRRCTQSLM